MTGVARGQAHPGCMGRQARRLESDFYCRQVLCRITGNEQAPRKAVILSRAPWTGACSLVAIRRPSVCSPAERMAGVGSIDHLDKQKHKKTPMMASALKVCIASLWLAHNQPGVAQFRLVP